MGILRERGEGRVRSEGREFSGGQPLSRQTLATGQSEALERVIWVVGLNWISKSEEKILEAAAFVKEDSKPSKHH